MACKQDVKNVVENLIVAEITSLMNQTVTIRRFVQSVEKQNKHQSSINQKFKNQVLLPGAKIVQAHIARRGQKLTQVKK